MASGLRHAYEILWGDEDAAAARWVREEFEYFWSQGVDLPDAVVKHVAAMASRIEYRSIEDARDATGAVPVEAVLAERPIYKGGQILRAWQKRFVQTCVEDHRLHGKARYLLADDVGLGKTLSMAAAALVLSILDDKPVLILAPATLIWQWQEELDDKLGLPAAVWSTQKKMLARQGTPTADAAGRCRAGDEVPMAHRDRVHRADHQRRRRGRAGRTRQEIIRGAHSRRGTQGARAPRDPERNREPQQRTTCFGF